MRMGPINQVRIEQLSAIVCVQDKAVEIENASSIQDWSMIITLIFQETNQSKKSSMTLWSSREKL